MSKISITKIKTKMFKNRQCCAPTKKNTRCTNYSIDGVKIHCPIHHNGGLKLYDRYKKACGIADSFDVEESIKITSTREQIVFLNKCYCAYIHAYEARMEHRNKYVVFECRDYGHDKQFVIIRNKTKLEEIYDKLITHQKKEITVEVDTYPQEVEHEEVKDLTFIDKVKDFKQKRVDDEKETNRVIMSYIQENSKLLKDKKNIIGECYSILLKFVTEDSKFLYHHMMAMFIVIIGAQEYMGNEKGKYSPDKVLKASYSSTFTLSSKDINMYSDMKEFFNEQHFDFILFLGRALASFGGIMDVFLTDIKTAWQETNFDPMLSTFKYKITPVRFDFYIN